MYALYQIASSGRAKQVTNKMVKPIPQKGQVL